MKPLVLLTGLAIIFAIATGGIGWLTQNSTPKTLSPSAESNRIKDAFQSDRAPLQTLDLDPLIRSINSKELLAPELTLPQSEVYSQKELILLSQYSQTCKTEYFQRLDKLTKSIDLSKAFQWSKFRCNPNQKISASYFSQAPFMAISGKSYARLATEAGVVVKNPRFHALEVLNNKLESISLKLSAWDLQNLLKSESIILAVNHVLLLSKVSEEKGIKQYLIYDRKSWDAYLKTMPLQTLLDLHSPLCLIAEGNLCWATNRNFENRNLRILSMLLFIAFLIILAALIFLIIKRSYQLKRESENKLFTLQMLTHELRTPATSIQLSLEALRKDFDQLPANSQKAFLQLCEENQRLGNVVENSKHYLSNEKLEIKKINLNSLIQNIISSEFSEQASIQFLADAEMMGNTHREGLTLCIKNLIQNAIHHGSLPIKVSLKKKQANIIISIIDQGKPTPLTLTEMTQSFSLSQSSKGLGLGLSIIQHTVNRMNAELKFQANPTTFSIILKDQNE